MSAVVAPSSACQGVGRPPLAREEKSRMATLDYIAQTVAAAYGLAPPDLRIKTRRRGPCWAAFVAMRLASEFIRGSTRDIADYFGRTHTMASHARRAVEQACDVYPEVKQEVDAFRKLVRQYQIDQS